MNFFEDIVKACNKEELDFIFKKQCVELDIHLFSVVHLSKKNEFKSLNTYPKEWLDLYLGNNFFLLDLVYDIINNTYLPQTWNINKFKPITDNHDFFLKKANEHEINYGFSIPIRGEEHSKIFFTQLYENDMPYETQYIMSHASILYWNKINDFRERCF